MTRATTAPELAQFKPFQWADTRKAHRLGAHAEAAGMVFAGRVRDIARGMVVVMQMLEHVAHDREQGDKPLIDNETAIDLQRLVIAVGGLLDAEAEQQLERLEHSVAALAESRGSASRARAGWPTQHEKASV